MDPKAIRLRLGRWYDGNARDLPWRRTRDPYRIWISEIMLQQTRVAAATPYYRRFLALFPTVKALAQASEEEVLAAWSGLGYYSRARNMHRAARLVAEAGSFPRDYEGLSALPGVGGYTAAAVASLAYGLPYAVVDGNVLRVLSRVTGERGDIGAAATRRRLTEAADAALDPKRPGRSNQALMELGALVCVPGRPDCGRCPIAAQCAAHGLGLEEKLLVKRAKPRPERLAMTLLVMRRADGALLLRLRGGAPNRGFWELPEAADLPKAASGRTAGRFRHAIMDRRYEVLVRRAGDCVGRAPSGFRWLPASDLARLPVTTMARKAIALWERSQTRA